MEKKKRRKGKKKEKKKKKKKKSSPQNRTSDTKGSDAYNSEGVAAATLKGPGENTGIFLMIQGS